MIFFHVAFNSIENQSNCNMRFEWMEIVLQIIVQCNPIEKIICIPKDSNPTNQMFTQEKILMMEILLYSYDIALNQTSPEVDV
jgi:hypothetical protein